jgi:hypothetical protein
MPGFDPEDFDDRSDGYRVIEKRRSEVRADAILAALSTHNAEGWRPIESAPYNQEVVVRVGEMTFLAKLMPDISQDEHGNECDQWQATREGEHPPCWSNGACWSSNEDEWPSLSPEAWLPATPIAAGQEVGS